MDKPPGLRWPDLLCAVSVLLLLLSLRARDDALRRLEEARRSVNATGGGGGGGARLVRQDVLVFNRVPKVGSVTVMNLVGLLRERNGFDAFTSLDGMPVQEGQVSYAFFVVGVVLQRYYFPSLLQSLFEKKNVSQMILYILVRFPGGYLVSGLLDASPGRPLHPPRRRPARPAPSRLPQAPELLQLLRVQGGRRQSRQEPRVHELCAAPGGEAHLLVLLRAGALVPAGEEGRPQPDPLHRVRHRRGDEDQHGGVLQGQEAKVRRRSGNADHKRVTNYWFGLVWFIQRFMSSLMAVFSQTAGSKKSLFSILVSQVLAYRFTVLA